jgi:peptidoglycan/LPS O-acetylase OafA/YrhL
MTSTAATPHHAGFQYRRDIDGMRAIAVGLVLLFHGKLLGVHGGFVGVDVFFVISGFLITSLIRQDLEAGRFSLVDFYVRRVKRIFPALIVVLAATFIAGLVILLPRDLENYSRSAAAAVLSMANFYFWRSGGYFSESSDLKPALHTWSLSVEEQFYLLLPATLLMLNRYVARHIPLILLGLLLVSLGLSIFGLASNKALPTFYLFPTRAWELLVGSLLAFARPSLPQAWMRSLAAILGLALIVGAGVIYDSKTPFPGLAALAPCLGAALLIVAGQGGRHLFSPMLESRAFVGIGLISYSLYLWHWPILVLARYVLVRELHWHEAVAALAAAGGLAYLSWKFVETPTRRLALKPRGWFAMFAAAAAAFCGAAVLLINAGGLPGRFAPEVNQLNAAGGTMYRCNVASYMAFGRYYACPITPGSNSANAEVILWGDSHAQMYVPGMATALESAGRKGILVPLNGCPPLAAASTAGNCLDINRSNLAEIERSAAGTVVLAMHWDSYRDRDYVLANGSGVRDAGFDRLLPELAATVERLRKAGKRVVVLAPIPTAGFDVPGSLSRQAAFGSDQRFERSVDRRDFERRMAPVFAFLGDAEAKGVVVIYPHRRLCGSVRCDFVQGGDPIFADANHLTATVARTFGADFGGALGAAR